jgi:hypothetical protein
MAVAAILYAYGALRTGFFDLDLRAYVGSTIASAPMGLVVFFTLSHFSSFPTQIALLPIVIIAGAFVYIGALRLMRILTESDFEFMRQMAPAGFQKIVALIARLCYPKR